MTFLYLNYETNTDKWSLHGKEGSKELDGNELKFIRTITFGQRKADAWAIRYYILGRKRNILQCMRIRLANFILGNL